MKRKTLNCNGRLLHISRPLLMGIVNITPDSFYDGGRYLTETAIINRCETIISEGADIIDIGAASTRPGAADTDAATERHNIVWALTIIKKHFPDAITSIDTWRADVAKAAVNDCGADIINDISAGMLDHGLLETVAGLRVPYILMHMQKTPATMQENPVYANPMDDLIAFFAERIHTLRTLGVNDIVIDPGFGFGKTVEHNYEILRRLRDLQIFNLPTLIGVSRKSMICKLLQTDPAHALNGTTAVHTLALMAGADILRVHDVKEAAECIKIVQAATKKMPPQ